MLTDQQRADIVNAVKPHELARMLVDRLPDEAQCVSYSRLDPDEDYPLYSINSEYVPVIAECLQTIVAYTVSTLIDAGSERDAVMENTELNDALWTELNGWTEEVAVQPTADHQ